MLDYNYASWAFDRVSSGETSYVSMSMYAEMVAQETGETTAVVLDKILNQHIPSPAYISEPLEDGIDIVSELKNRGFGDTIAEITHMTGIDKLAELYTRLTGKPCGCADRQAALNKLFPYGVVER